MDKDVQQLFLAAMPLIDFAKKYADLHSAEHDPTARQALNHWNLLRGSIGVKE